MTLFPKDIQKVISTYKIFDFIPLDKTLHVIVGMIVTISMRSFGLKMRWIFLCLVILEIIKESIDNTAMTATTEEHLLDVLATVIYPLILLIVIAVKKNLQGK